MLDRIKDLEPRLMLIAWSDHLHATTGEGWEVMITPKTPLHWRVPRSKATGETLEAAIEGAIAALEGPDAT